LSRVVQPQGSRGSLKWIQRAVNTQASALNDPILAAVNGPNAIEWLSPLASDDYAEYRDAEFLQRIGAGDLAPDLAKFWPQRGPQWDALARTDRGDLLLIEAKAHIGEILSPGTQAGDTSRPLIEASLAQTANAMGAQPRAAWSDTLFQLANRFAHLHFLRSHNRPAWLVLVGFIRDSDMNGPETAREWDVAYEVAMHVMGLSMRHPLSRYVIHVHPDVALLI